MRFTGEVFLESGNERHTGQETVGYTIQQNEATEAMASKKISRRSRREM